jgi:hypothetical protein
MVANQLQSIDQSRKRDECLLLSLDGNVLFSLNESASVVWSNIEKNPLGVSTEQLVDHLDSYFSRGSVSRVRLRRDVEELLTALSNRGFLRIAGGKGSEQEYRIKDDVFRTNPDEMLDARIAAELDEEFETAVAYRPHEPPDSDRLRAFKDTWLGVVAIILYETLLRVLGFGRLCVTIERWPVLKGRRWLPIRVRQICAGVDRARLWYPKKVLCLQHSAVVTCLLRRQGIPAQMIFGARQKPFYAHAWSEVYGVVVNDDQTVRSRYHCFIRCLGSWSKQSKDTSSVSVSNC